MNGLFSQPHYVSYPLSQIESTVSKVYILWHCKKKTDMNGLSSYPHHVSYPSSQIEGTISKTSYIIMAL